MNISLAGLAVGDSGIIAGANNERLKTLGFVAGANVVVLRRKRGCLHVKVGSTEWAIRCSTAEYVELKDENT